MINITGERKNVHVGVKVTYSKNYFLENKNILL